MLKLDTIYHGFRLNQSEFVEEIESKALIFKHEVTKAELVFLTNSDDNKVFMISFFTPPEDDTGVTHILEHSVLNGSKKFPLKDPFSELLKSSLYTFLNAMTYPDRTVYPVASRNLQDFKNLMDVYLDAVFNPLLGAMTFQQEGWHHCLNTPEESLEYSGVVYNEMLGAYSDPENILIDEMSKRLFPSSIYGRSSGGNPEVIPELSYAQFKEYYKKYYHPSNCKIAIYGDVDVLETLSILEGYLDKFEVQVANSIIKPQKRLSLPANGTAFYPISSTDHQERKSYALRSYLLGHPTDELYMLGMTILSRIIGGTPASPLRKALIDSHLGEGTLNYGFENDVFDHYYSIGLKGIDQSDSSKMDAIIDNVLSGLSQNSIDQKLIQASINSIEFQLREANFGGYPKGVCYGLAMLNSWTYGADPLMHLRYENSLQKIKGKAFSSRYFENLIEQYFLNNKHATTVTLCPDPGLEQKRVGKLTRKLQEKKSQLTPEQLTDLVRENRKLQEFQQRSDSPEALASIPKLPLHCIQKSAEVFPFAIKAKTSPHLSFSNLATNGIAYLMVALDASGVPHNLLPYLPIFSQLTLLLGTHKKSYVDLIQEIDIHTGGMSCAYQTTPIKDKPNEINSHVTFCGKALTHKIGNLCHLLNEIFTECNFSDQKRIHEVLKIAKSNLQSRMIPNGHSFAASRIASYSSKIGRFRERACGIRQYHFLERIVNEFHDEPHAFISKIREISRLLFNKAAMKIHLTGSPRELEVLQQDISKLLAGVFEKSIPREHYDFDSDTPDEGFIIPSKIQYVGKGMNLFDLGYKYNGHYEVLETILSRDYLWNHVRVRGGAYGCFANLDSLSGNFCCISYRDPNLEETIDVFDKISDYIKELPWSDNDLEKFIISTIGTIDAPKTQDQKGATAFGRFLSNVSNEEVQTRRDQILSTRIKDLECYGALFEEFRSHGKICVVGSEEKIKRNERLFSSVSSIFNPEP